jgi:ketosteroid isomerase-like protein
VSEALEVVRQNMDMWLRNEREAALACWAEDASITSPENWPEAGSSTGVDEVRAVFDGFDDAFGPEWPTQMTIPRIEEAADGRVLVEFDWKPSGASSGISMDLQIAGVYTVNDGKITDANFFTSHEEGRRAAGLA